MPGIVGIIGSGSFSKNTALLHQMVERMTHETFYTSGIYLNEQLGLCVGWVCRTGSFADCMPVWNETKDICLIFNGEIYSDKSEVDRLRGQGHQFKVDDASYLVHLYEDLGSNFYVALNGWFSGILIDLRQRKTIIFNDRYGLSRIYQHDTGHGFYFASEAKALLAVLPNLRQLNPESLAEFFSCGCPLNNKTLFSGMSIIPGGSTWAFIPGQNVNKEFYFRPEIWENQETLSSSEYYDKLKATFTRVLPRYFNGKEQVGVSLTGGVDSRMVMAWSNVAAGHLPSYTFGGMFRDCIDVKIARRVAKICNQPHHIIHVGNEFLSQFSDLAEKTVYITDGGMDVSGSADLFVNKIVREIAPARLTGNYGGEVLRSIVAFKPMPLLETLFEQGFRGLMQSAALTYLRELSNNRLSFVAFKQVPWHHYSRLSLELSQITLRSPYLDNELVALAYQVPREHATSNEFMLRLIAEGNPVLGKIGTDRGILFQSVPILSMLKHWYQEFTFKAEYAYDYGMPQSLARIDNIFSSLHLERLFLGRHKFYHFRYWYRYALAQYIKDILLDPRSLGRPYLDGRCLDEVVRRHTSGQGNYTLEIHRLLTVELIQRLFIENQ